MGAIGPWQLIIILVIVLLLFGGRGKIPKLMRDMGQGINAFKKGLKTEDKGEEKAESESESESEPKKVAESEPAATTAARVEEKEKDAAASG